MGSYSETGFDEYDKELADMTSDGSHTLVLVNAAEHAEYVQKMKGKTNADGTTSPDRWVFNDEHFEATVDRKMAEVERSLPLTPIWIKRGLYASGVEEINYLQSITSELIPGWHRGDGPRRAHPGHWGDRSTQLNRGYHIEVDGVSL